MIATTENIAGSSTEFSPRSQFVPAAPRPKIRVWLTDDNSTFRELLEELLLRSGEFDCERQFHSAESLLAELADGAAPDVILLDVEMGGMTGVDALRPIRALAPDVRVLIVTSFFDPMYESHAKHEGAAFLIKAHAPQNLVREIHQAIASPVKIATVAFADALLAAKRGLSATPMPPARMATSPRKNLVTRFSSWAAQWSANLFGQLPYHRPAVTPE
jgi:DNA-binding NarL/FixJ family response regulator